MNKKIIVFTLLLAAVLSHVQFSTEWTRFKRIHSKQYSSESEELRRYQIFSENLRNINLHNENFENGHETFRQGVNDKSDMTWEEFRDYYRLDKVSKTPEIKEMVELPEVTDLPDSLDWNEIGAVTPAMDQGACVSSWSFTAIGVMEGAYFIVHNKTKSISAQQLVDCDTSNLGCSGGDTLDAFDYYGNSQAMLESDYKYTGFKGTCKYDETKGVMPFGLTVTVRGKLNMLRLMQSLVILGPHGVIIDANHQEFMTYQSGVFKINDCSSTKGTQNVLLVGYGKENDQEYWLIKNSWGTSWGINGFAKMYKSNDNMCGVMTLPAIAWFHP